MPDDKELEALKTIADVGKQLYERKRDGSAQQDELDKGLNELRVAFDCLSPAEASENSAKPASKKGDWKDKIKE